MSNAERLSHKVLIPEIRIKNRIKELSQQINYDYQDKELVIVCVLKGSFIFFADLIRELEVPLSCEFLGLSSYGGKMETSGEVKVTLDITEPLKGKNVLIVEDIVDSGLTLQYMLNMLRARQPGSLRVCALLHKPDAMKVKLDIDYLGFKIGNEFVVGYGVDYQERLRCLPYIGIVEKEH